MSLSLFLLATASVARWQNWGGTGDTWLATRELVFKSGQYWRLFTTIFIHSNMGHLLGNMLTFSILSFLLWGYYGVFIYPLCALFFGALTNALTLLTYPPGGGLLGASGVVYWMAGFWVTLYFGIDRRYSAAGRLLRCAGFSLAVFAPTSYDPNVAYRTHAIGFGLGILFGTIYFLFRRHDFRRAERWLQEIEEEVSVTS